MQRERFSIFFASISIQKLTVILSLMHNNTLNPSCPIFYMLAYYIMLLYADVAKFGITDSVALLVKCGSKGLYFAMFLVEI